MAARGVLACQFNLRSRDKVKQFARSKVTPKKSAVNTDSDATEKRSKHPRSRNTVAKVSGSTQRQLRPRKVDKNQNTIEEAFKRSSSKKANQQQCHSKEQNSTTKSQKTDETNKKLPIYKSINPEKSLEDQDSVYEFTFDPNDTQEKIQKKKRVNVKKRKKRDTKTTQNNIKNNKNKRCDTHITEDKISSVATLAKQTKELNIKNGETENIKKKKKKQTNIEAENTKKKKKKQIDIHPAEDKIPLVTELANLTQELNAEEVETENTKKEKKQTDIHNAEDKKSLVTELAKQTQELNTEKVETENNKKDKEEQIDIHTAEDKILLVTELAKQTEDLSVESVETENTKKEKEKKIDIHTAEDKKSPVTELAKQTQELNMKDVETENKKDQQVDTAEEEISSVTTLAEQNEKLNKSTPKIISIENVDNMLVNRISSTENFRSPLRPRNLVDNTIVKQQRKDDSNYLSLTKSLSPISNTAGVINIDSPWRPPTLSMFSRAKYFVQSTPKVMQTAPKVHSKINKKSLVKGKENKQAIKKKDLVTKNKPAIDGKTIAEQENQENKFLETDKEDRHLTNGETVEEQKNEHLVKDKENNEIPTKQENKHLIDFLNFSDTFDVLSESERRSTFGTEIRLFEDAEPTHFSEPPKRIYKRKLGVRVNFSEESDKEENKENARENKQEPKKKRKYRKVDKENEKRISEWIQSVNSSFEEIDNYDLLVE